MDLYPNDDGIVRWFGTNYYTPMHDSCPEVETPVGELCYLCDEPIKEEDAGFTQAAYIRRDEEGKIYSTREVSHRRCFLVSTIGEKMVKYLEDTYGAPA